jgi:hypothetical protein
VNEIAFNARFASYLAKPRVLGLAQVRDPPLPTL